MCFSYLWCMCLLHLCCVGHGGNGVTMEVLMVFLLTFFHDCMTSYLWFLFIYCLWTFTYMLLHVVYPFLFNARSHIGNSFVLSMYAFLCDAICGTWFGHSWLVIHVKWVHMVKFAMVWLRLLCISSLYAIRLSWWFVMLRC